MTEPIKLPPLPEPLGIVAAQTVGMPLYSKNDLFTFAKHYGNQCAHAAIEADRQERHLKEKAQLEQEWSEVKRMQTQYEADRQARGEPVKYVMSEDEVFESLYDAAVSHIDSNGISVIEPDILSSLVRVLAVAVTDEEGFFPQPQQQASEPVAWLRSDELRKLGHPYSDAPLNSKTDSMMLHAKGTQEAAAKYGHDVPVFTAPQPQQIPEGYRLQPISEFDAMMCTRTIPEGYKLVPQRLISLCEQFTKWRHCMSYNDSYFGEPEGDLKRIAAEMERAMLEAAPESKGQ